tara:strand:+ start:1037 stop:1846 length:810 start_codon:yes stop_codon:yes gene_type:complete
MQNDNNVPMVASTLENIDTAMFRFVDESLNAQVKTNKGIEKVKVLWLGSERSFQIKNNKELRDGVGKLRLPIITVARTSVSKDDAFKGSVQSEELDGDRIQIKRIIKQDKTQNFKNADRKRETGDDTGPTSSKKVVYETISIPRPVYVSCTFEIFIRTEYQQQMNDILPLFVTQRKRNFIVQNNGYRYEAFADSDYSINNSGNLAEDERMFTAKATIKILGYLTGNKQNEDEPFVQRKESIVEVKISRERVIVGDRKPWDKSDEKFRDL